MAWNEPGKGGGNPWNGGGGGGDQRPPDIDKVVRDFQQKINSLFGRKGGGGGGNSAGLGVLVAIAAVLWGASGLYTVDASERGVVLQFGKFHSVTSPGLRWHIPWPIQDVEKVNVSAIERYKHSTRMLTSDENLVIVDTVVQYRRTEPEKYLFNVNDPEGTLGEVTESAIREIVASEGLDVVLTLGRADIAQRTEIVIQETLNQYETGLEVTSVNLQDINFPTQVQAAVQDAIKAREDQERLALEAEAYANDVVPVARGNAARLMQEAEAYRDRVIAEAEGQAARFLALLAEYERAPEVTRQRLFFETVEEVFGSTGKVLLDSQGSGNLVYLPVDQLLKQQSQMASEQPRTIEGAPPPRDSQQAASRRNRNEARTRGSR